MFLHHHKQQDDKIPHRDIPLQNHPYFEPLPHILENWQHSHNFLHKMNILDKELLCLRHN
jgi:hypothetical protein